MIMKKILILVFFAMFSAHPHAAEVDLTLVANAPPGGPGDKLWRMFEDNIAAKAGTRIQVKKLVHGELGGDDVGFQAIRKGRGQMGIAGENGFAQAIPEASVLNLPFLFSSPEECDFVFDNVWTPEAKRIADAAPGQPVHDAVLARARALAAALDHDLGLPERSEGLSYADLAVLLSQSR